MSTNDTPPRHQVEIVEVSREELLRQRAALLDRIDHDVRVELEQVDFLLGDTAAAQVAAAETSPRMTAEQQVRMLQDVMASQAAHIAAITEALGLSYEADTDEVVAAIRAHAAAPVAGDPTGGTSTEVPAVWWSPSLGQTVHYWDLRGIDEDEALRRDAPQFHYWSVDHADWETLHDLPADAVELRPAMSAGETRTEWGVRLPGLPDEVNDWEGDKLGAQRAAEMYGGEHVQRHVGPWTPATPSTDTAREG